MVMQLFSKIFGTKNSRELKRMNRIVMRVNEFEVDTGALTDSEISHKREIFRARLDAEESLDSILPEAFAVVREAGK
ncbi:uncharacterized protein METZ01_LOCUS114795, partial [marine metagenome]